VHLPGEQDEPARRQPRGPLAPSRHTPPHRLHANLTSEGHDTADVLVSPDTAVGIDDGHQRRWFLRFGEQIEATAWYVLAEALSNVVKHAAASEVEVSLSQEDGRLGLVIRDDGRGFDLGRPRGLGLTGLSDRLDTVGGSLTITSGAGLGTSVCAHIPVGPDQDADCEPAGYEPRSGRLPVAGYFSHLVLVGLPGDVDPARVAIAGDVHADEGVEGSLVDAVISVAHDDPVDVA